MLNLSVAGVSNVIPKFYIGLNEYDLRCIRSYSFNWVNESITVIWLNGEKCIYRPEPFEGIVKAIQLAELSLIELQEYEYRKEECRRLGK